MAHWVAAIADNVMNPIAGISAALTIAEQQLELRRAGEQASEATLELSFRMIRARLESLTEYVAELADFANPASLSPIPLQVADELVAVCAAINSSTRYGINVDVKTSVSAGVIVADQAKLRLVLKALLINAVEAVAGVESPCVGISASASRDGGSVELVVEDNGPGFAPEALKHAFEPFYSTKEAGTGLGLSIVRKYVDAHAGALTIDRSAKLGGSRITLRFPVPTDSALNVSQKGQRS